MQKIRFILGLRCQPLLHFATSDYLLYDYSPEEIFESNLNCIAKLDLIGLKLAHHLS
jgi:hypothetical protein